MNTSGKTEVTSARFRWCPTTPRGALGRALPLGGEVPQDYVFERIGRTNMPETVKMSELFGPHDTLILYSFMYGPERELPCPGCTHLLDGIYGAARHIGERAALHIVAK
jgi:predicted dithiol-disulfide oxidoreductase (DUF899 family)